MSVTPVISVITITLNDHEGLASTAESLMEQDGLDQVEWVIVDGGSTDGTLELALTYVEDPRAPARTRVLEGPDNGIVDAMTRGAAAATGAYLQFLNSGDRYHGPDALATVLEIVRPDRPTTEQPAWLYGQAQVVDEAHRAVRPLHARRYSRLGHAYHFVRINHQAVFLRCDIMARAGGFRAETGTALDFDLLLRVGRLESPEVIDEVLIDYLEGGISQRAFSDRIRRVGAIRRDEFGLTGLTAAADLLFAHAFISYSQIRRILKRLAIATFGDRFLGWWGNRRIGSSSVSRPESGEQPGEPEVRR